MHTLHGTRKGLNMEGYFYLYINIYKIDHFFREVGQKLLLWCYIVMVTVSFPEYGLHFYCLFLFTRTEKFNIYH